MSAPLRCSTASRPLHNPYTEDRVPSQLDTVAIGILTPLSGCSCHVCWSGTASHTRDFNSRKHFARLNTLKLLQICTDLFIEHLLWNSAIFMFTMGDYIRLSLKYRKSPNQLDCSGESGVNLASDTQTPFFSMVFSWH